jgi:death-on-curing protein
VKRTLVQLTVEAVEAIHVEVLVAHGGGAGIRDRGLLESAVAAPQATFGGEPVFGEARDVAAAYLFYLCRNHPFIDGNKRVALAACLVFLDANGLLPDPDLPGREVDRWEAFVLDVASSRLDREQTAARLRALLKPKTRRPPRRRSR